MSYIASEVLVSFSRIMQHNLNLRPDKEAALLTAFE
jgi:hypothetical protein